MIKVYIAGMYSKTGKGETAGIIDGLRNISKGVRMGTRLLQKGFAPFCPWLDAQFILAEDELDNPCLTEEIMKAYSLEWLRSCDALLIIGHNWQFSPGTMIEYKLANKLGIPVFWQLWDLIIWSKTLKIIRKKAEKTYEYDLYTDGFCYDEPESEPESSDQEIKEILEELIGEEDGK